MTEWLAHSLTELLGTWQKTQPKVVPALLGHAHPSHDRTPAQLRERTRHSISGSNLPTGFRRSPFPSYQPRPRPYRLFDTIT